MSEQGYTTRPERNRPVVLTVWQEFLAWTFDRTNAIPKGQRFTFGQRIDGHALDILEMLVQATFTTEKRVLLDTINLRLEVLRVLWRIVQQRGWISLRQLHFAQEKLDETGRMIGAWRKQVEGRKR